jgi:hypothetical protein
MVIWIGGGTSVVVAMAAMVVVGVGAVVSAKVVVDSTPTATEPAVGSVAGPLQAATTKATGANNRTVCRKPCLAFTEASVVLLLRR